MELGVQRLYRRKPGKNWMDIIRWDLKDMDYSWDEAEELATDRTEWRQRVAQCIHQDTGWTKVLYSLSRSEIEQKKHSASYHILNTSRNQ